MGVMFIEQNVGFEENHRIYGTYVVSCDDEEYQKELEEDEVRIGHVSFEYDMETNNLSFEPSHCTTVMEKYYQQLVETVWSKVKLIRNYWKSGDYRMQMDIEQRIRKHLK